MGAGAAAVTLSGARLHAEPRQGEPLPLGRDLPFDFDWRFYRGDGEGFEKPEFDPGHWRVLDLPHDWSVEDAPDQQSPDVIGPFVRSAIGGTDTGFTVGGEGWYRKEFTLPDLGRSGRVEIQFDGVSVVSEVWVNGRHVGEHVHGYTAFAYDISRYVRAGAGNTIAVRVTNIGRNSRWYAGSGIYRSVTLNILPESAHIARWGVAAWTRRIGELGAEIDVTTRLEDVGEGLVLATRLIDRQGEVVAEASSTAARAVQQTLRVASPKLWNIDAPNLYLLETVLARGDEVIDRVRESYGIRIVSFDVAQGITINGQRVRLRGGCVHHDNGLLGAVSCPDAEERKVRLLKARGFNAIRSSHNPTSKALRQVCDRLGMLVIEESFDMWHAEKLPDDYSHDFAGHWKDDLHSMVLAARNSPSVIMWSIGNEIPERATDEGVEWCWRLANEVRRLDPTRPVTAAINGSPGRPLIASEGTARPGDAGQTDHASSIFLDVIGYNYKFSAFERDHALRPDRIFYGSETYPREAYDYLKLAEAAPYMLGEFVWTAMDYLGEAGIGLTRRLPDGGAHPAPHEFPVVVSYCGDIDLIGEQKPQSLARDTLWGLSPLEVTVARPLPAGMVEFVPLWGWPEEQSSWTWPGHEGKQLKVRLYTGADRVEVLLDGELVGERKLTAADRMRTELAVAYAPGRLEVVAYSDGLETGRRQLETAGAPSQIKLTAEQDAGSAARQSLHYLRVDIVDDAGRRVPHAESEISASVTGPAEILGFGSANPRAVGSIQSGETRAFQGQAQLVLRSTGAEGDLRISVKGAGLKAGNSVIRLI
jgi:beta-galactosidase